MKKTKTSLMVEKVEFYSKDKDGKEYITKFGKPYKKAKITNAGKNIYINVFNKEQQDSIMVGNQIELEVEKNGEYLNYSLPRKKTPEELKLEELENRISKLEDFVYKGNQGEPEIGGHVEEIKDGDMPW